MGAAATIIVRRILGNFPIIALPGFYLRSLERAES